MCLFGNGFFRRVNPLILLMKLYSAIQPHRHVPVRQRFFRRIPPNGSAKSYTLLLYNPTGMCLFGNGFSVGYSRPGLITDDGTHRHSVGVLAFSHVGQTSKPGIFRVSQ
jgi:hypothetical protein